MIERLGLRLALAGILLAGCYGAPAGSDAPTTETPAASTIAAATLDADQPTFEAGPSVATATQSMPTPTPEPTATPRPAPSVELQVNGVGGDPRVLGFESGESIDMTLGLRTEDLLRTDCTIRHRYVPDKPGFDETIESLPPRVEQTLSLRDGWHYFTARCPSIDGELVAKMSALAADWLPEKCAGFDFPAGSLTATTVDELATGMTGHWHGCATVPWEPVYWVDFTFRADGSYSAEAGEVLDDWDSRAMYYDMNGDDPDKRWGVLGIADGVGTGEITLVFEPGKSETDQLEKIRLMGDALSFEFLSLGEYGPLTFKLVRD